MQENRLSALYEPFELKERVGLGGMKFKYIPSDDIIDRMNRVFRGNWSTEVVSENVVEDTVVLRVRLFVLDEETGKVFHQEGYGSSSHKRYTSGQNSGKIIDAGNAYKSALSMAIRNAASKFGCGLYLEEHDTDIDTNKESKSGASIPSQQNFIQNFTKTEKVLENTVNLPPLDAGKKMDVEKVIPPAMVMKDIKPLSNIENTKILDNGGESFSLPPAPAPKMDIPISIPTSKLDIPVNMPKPTIAQTNFISTPPFMSEVQSDAMSDIQKIAIDGLVNIKGFESYEQLVSEALGVSVENVPSKTLLTMSEAREVIKYGNQKVRGK